MEAAKIRERIQQFEEELRQGERVLHELDAKRDQVKGTMLRISGALDVLRPMLAEMEQSAVPGEGQA